MPACHEFKDVQDITDDATVRPPLLMGILEITAHFSPIC